MCPSLIQIGSKTAEKNSAQTNRQTNRHYENNGHLAVNQYMVGMLHCVLDTLLWVAEAVAIGNDTTDAQLNATLAASSMPAEATRVQTCITNTFLRQTSFLADANIRASINDDNSLKKLPS